MAREVDSTFKSQQPHTSPQYMRPCTDDSMSGGCLASVEQSTPGASRKPAVLLASTGLNEALLPQRQNWAELPKYLPAQFCCFFRALPSLSYHTVAGQVLPYNHDTLWVGLSTRKHRCSPRRTDSGSNGLSEVQSCVAWRPWSQLNIVAHL